MKVIESTDNKIYKQLLGLSQKKHRDREGLYLVEGENLVGEAIAAGMAKMVILRDDITPTNYELDTVFMKGKLFSKVAQTETSQGIIAVVEKKPQQREAFLQEIGKGRGNVLVLDRLQDPGNIGTMLRTASGAGYSGVVIQKGTGDIYSPKVVRAAAGVLLRLPMWFSDTVKETVELLEEAGKTIIGTGPRESVPYYSIPLKENVALVIGNEGNGMSEEFLAMTHKNIYIPMEGGTESLNAAVAAGILMYKSVEEG